MGEGLRWRLLKLQSASQERRPASREKNPAVTESRAAAELLLDSRRISEQEATRNHPLGGRGNRHEREREGASAREVGGRVRQAHFRGSKWRLRSPRPRFPLMVGEAGASPDSPRTDSDDSDLRRRRDTEPLCSAPGFVLMLRMCCAGPNRPLRAGQVFLLI